MNKFICSLLCGLSLLGCNKVSNEVYKPYPKRAAAAYVQKFFTPDKKEVDIDQMLADLDRDTAASMGRIKGYMHNINELEQGIKQDEQEVRQYAQQMFGTDYKDKDLCGMLDAMNQELDERIKTANELVAIAKKCE